LIKNKHRSSKTLRSDQVLDELLKQLAELRTEVKQMRAAAEPELRRLNNSLIESEIGARRNVRFAMERQAVEESGQLAMSEMLNSSSFSHPDDTLAYALSLAPSGGLALEFGVYSGGTLNKIAKARGDGRVYGFDSFQGLPEAWRADFPAGAFAVNQLPEVKDAELVVGWFNQTLPGFLQQHPEPVDFLHVDCDLYSSTRTVFDYVGSRLRAGSVVLFDEFFNYTGWREHEFKAWNEYVQSSGTRFCYEAYTFNNEQVALRILETPDQS